MKYLSLIDATKSLYDGFLKLNKNFHMLDILVSNLYYEKSKWNNVYSLYIGKSEYDLKFAEIQDFLDRYSNIIEILRLYRGQWLSPMTLIYPTIYTNTDFSVDSVLPDVIEWLTINYPNDSLPLKKVINLYITIQKDDNADRYLLGTHLITFRNDNLVWVKIEDYYRPHGC